MRGRMMKRSKLSYDEWKCIKEKSIRGRNFKTDFFVGYIGIIEIGEVTEPQIWKFNGEDIVVCDKGLKWLSILPKDDFYCVTAMMNENNEILVWYIDMIASQDIDGDDIPYFYDLYLDLVVYPDGTVIEDDRDELETALANGDITLEQYNLALTTSAKLKKDFLSDITFFMDYTYRCLKMLNS